MRAAFALLIALPLCARAADPKPDFTLTAEAYAKEARADGKAFREKYKGKIVELTATVWNPRVSDGDVLLNGWRGKPSNLQTEVFSALPKGKKLGDKLEPRLRALARGQKVTVRGKQDGNSTPVLVDCEFVKIGPSTAIPATVSGLVADFTKDEKAADDKYRDKSVVLRAKVLVAKAERDVVKWTLGDATGKGGPKIEAVADPLYGDPLKTLEKVKPGDTIILIADVGSFYGTPCGLAYPRLLDQPPEGVKLPGGKK
jgi:hypothetical protein